MTLVGKIVSFLLIAISFLFFLVLKLCYSTAVFATVAEVHRRVQVFRQNRRPPLRAIVLVPVVILFCSLVLFALWAWPLVTNDIVWRRPTLASLAWVILRVGFLGAGALLGGVLGVIIGRNIPMGRDRFGGVVVRNRGRYLMVWVGAFSVCGMFRLMPWGFVTYWVVWALVLASCLVAGTHFVLHRRFRALRGSASRGLAGGGLLDLTLAADEAVALSALVRGGATDASTTAGLLATGDVAWSSHPTWAGLAGELGADTRRLEQVLARLVSRGLVRSTAGQFEPIGEAERLSALVVADRSVALSTKTADGSVTRVVTIHGPSAVLWEPGPQDLRIREVARGGLAGALLG